MLKGQSSPKRALTDKQVARVLDEYEKSTAVREIARLVRVSPQAVYNIINGKTYQNVASGSNK